ncbi:MAG TPA: hypothetical protein VFR49_13465, partial [Solirubrobacteraceae bacterium]|nr:hypothetical protein [Solirubrobacteraceae bacterium]
MTTKPVHHTGPPGAPPPAQRGAPEVTGDPFAAILETTQARTATPEGHSERIADRDPRSIKTDDAAPVAEDAVAVATVVPAPEAPVTPDAPAAVADVPVADQPVTDVPAPAVPAAPLAVPV